METIVTHKKRNTKRKTYSKQTKYLPSLIDRNCRIAILDGKKNKRTHFISYEQKKTCEFLTPKLPDPQKAFGFLL